MGITNANRQGIGLAHFQEFLHFTGIYNILIFHHCPHIVKTKEFSDFRLHRHTKAFCHLNYLIGHSRILFDRTCGTVDHHGGKA